MHNKPNNRLSIEEVVEEFSARIEDGEHPSINEYVKRHPELADKLEAVLPAIVALEVVDPEPGDRRLVVDDSIPETLGDYTLLQEVGRGGMGIVFEAEHSALRRRVALKVLPKSVSDRPNYVNRFRNEARSAGQLHHTNIVPVFDTGQAEGIHFYAMQYIQGDNLDRVIEDIRLLRQLSSEKVIQKRHQSSSELTKSIARSMLTVEHLDPNQVSNAHEQNRASLQTKGQIRLNSTENKKVESVELRTQNGAFRQASAPSLTEQNSSISTHSNAVYHLRVAAIGAQVADALEHAHNHGVLHRDVKPSNLILDTDGNVWITDFGLAKLETTDLTQTGDIVGTLRYMAPERFAGEADARSDIYSLGLTLYEMCTLTSAFKNDRGSILKDVARSSSIVQPRVIDDTIPPDLETIVLKAMQSEPDKRYQSASAMAEDLRLFLADRPIKARRTSSAEKIWRVCRRNPIPSTLAACLCLLLVVIAMGSIEFARSEIKTRKASQKQLYLSKLDQAKMRRLSNRPGQRFESLNAIQEATRLLPEMDFSPSEKKAAKFLLRSEAVAAMSLNDIQPIWKKDLNGNERPMAFTMDGSLLANSQDNGDIEIFNTVDRELVSKLKSPDGEPTWTLEFSNDGQYLISRYHIANAGFAKMTTVVWDIDKGETLIQLKNVRYFAFSSDSRFLGVTYNDHVDIISLPNCSIQKTFAPNFTADNGKARHVIFNDDSTKVAISRTGSGQIEFWNIEFEPEMEHVVEVEESAYVMDWSSQRKLFVVGSSRGSVYSWKGDLTKDPRQIKVHQNTIFRIYIHPKRNLIATCAWDSTSRLTSLLSGEEVLRIEKESVLPGGFSSLGRLFLKDDSFAKICKVASPLIEVFTGADGKGFVGSFHPTRPTIVARSNGTSIEIWDTECKKIVAKIPDINSRQIKFANDSRLYVSGLDGFHRWTLDLDESEGATSAAISNHEVLSDRRCNRFQFFADCTRAAVGVGNHVSIFDLTTKVQLRKVGPHKNLGGLAVTIDDKHVLTGTWHGYGIKVWDLASGKLLKTIQEDEDSVAPVAHPCQPDTFYSNRGTVRQFKIKPDGAVKLVSDLGVHGAAVPSSSGPIIGVRQSSYYFKLMNSETHELLADFVSVGQSRIIDADISTDNNRLAFFCYENMQIVDLSKVHQSLKRIGLDW